MSAPEADSLIVAAPGAAILTKGNSQWSLAASLPVSYCTCASLAALYEWAAALWDTHSSQKAVRPIPQKTTRG